MQGSSPTSSVDDAGSRPASPKTPGQAAPRAAAAAAAAAGPVSAAAGDAAQRSGAQGLVESLRSQLGVLQKQQAAKLQKAVQASKDAEAKQGEVLTTTAVAAAL